MPGLSCTIKYLDHLSSDEFGFWRSFYSENVSPDPFLHPTFALAAWQSGIRVKVLIARNMGKTVGIFPFQHKNSIERFLGIGERVGGEMSDRMDALSLSGHSVQIDHLLNNLCALRIDHSRSMLSQDSDRIGYRFVAAEKSLQDIASENRSRFQNLANRRRKLHREIGDVTTTTTNTPTLFEIDGVLAHKRRQYMRTGALDVFASDKNRELLYGIWARSDEKYGLHLTKTVAGDQWIASHLGLRVGHVLHYWFPVYNTNYKIYSPGLILLEDLINKIAADGISQIDYGEGEADYKRIFSNESYKNHKSFVSRNTPRGLVAKFYEAVQWRRMQKRRTKARS